MTITRRVLIASLGAGAISSPAFATDGFFSNGYGTQQKGIGGAGIAYPKDSLGIANNPAGALFLGTRFDIGVEYLKAFRDATISGNAFGADGTYSGDGRTNFLSPELGYVRQINPDWAVGIAAYGLGGINTKYGENPYGAFGATGTGGINFSQLFVSPTVAYQIAPGHSVGASLNIGYQRFRPYGVGVFGGFSESPDNVSNKGADFAFGAGFRVGYLGNLTPRLSLGAVYTSTTYFDEFDKYKGILPDQGDFDVPPSYGFGLSYKLTPKLDITGEVQRILHSESHAVSNPTFSGKPFGSANGPGFGWDDINVYRAGLNYQLNEQWQLRGGWAYTTQPIPEDHTFIGILAPAVVQHQFTAGFTWEKPNSGWEISGYALYAPEEEVKGKGSIPANFGGGEADIRLTEYLFGLQFGYKFGEPESLKDSR